MGDGFCEDEINVETCDFDGGDCCLNVIITNYCDKCVCHWDGTRHPSSIVLPENKTSLTS